MLPLIVIGVIIVINISYIGLRYLKTKEEQSLEKTTHDSWQLTWDRDMERHIVFKPSSTNNIIFDGWATKVVRMSFERFLSFYSISPEKWMIISDDYNAYHNFAFYIKPIPNNYSNKTVIPVYWETPEDLAKYYHWVENQFEVGNAALHQNARDASLKELTTYIQQDIQEKREKFEEEMRELESRTKQDMEKLEKKHEIQLTLDPQPNKKYYTTDPNFNTVNYVGQGQELPTQNLKVGDIFHEIDTDTLFYYTKDGWDVLRPFAD